MSEQSQVSAGIPARLVLEHEVFDRVVGMLERPPAPTQGLLELMRGVDLEIRQLARDDEQNAPGR